MKIVIPGGSGQVGRVLARHFQRRGDQVVVLTRGPHTAEWQTVHWDGQTPGIWTQFLEGADVCINLTGRSVNCRYTPDNRVDIYNSRIVSTRLLGEVIGSLRNPPRLWLNASTATIYRHALDRPMDAFTAEQGSILHGLGYLPGDIPSKIDPYMQPLWDNLSIIKNQYGEREREYRKVEELVESEKLHIVPLAYIRGRSFSNVIFIVDEAQNLTPHEIKTIITRAGERTKIVLTGDIFQIDTPYLDAHTNGLSYLIDRTKGSALYTHVNLEKGERSELANLASRLL